MRVAILGTGRMGGAMARRLHQQGFELTLWNRTPEKARALEVGEVAATPGQAVLGAAVVITSMADDFAAREVYTQPEGVLQGVEDQVLVEASTISPDLAVELAGRVRERGGRFLDAPVLGSVPAVLEGQLAVLAGGEQADLERALPVLRALGEVRHVGSVGAAARLKLVANSMLAGISGVAAELEAAGVEIGLDEHDVFWVLARLAPYLGARERGYVEDVHQPVMFPVSALLKDLDLALTVFRHASAPTPYTSLSRQLFGEAAEEYADLDLSAIARYYRRSTA
jgi:3-hydroxyisobutyrate dehydrogenase-like beta-hydroxyacid dehydrogenase